MGMAMVVATAVVLDMSPLLPLCLISTGVVARRRLLWGDGAIGLAIIIGMTIHIMDPITGDTTDITMGAHTTRHRPRHAVAPAIITAATGFISIIVTTAQFIRGADGFHNPLGWVHTYY